MVSASGMDLICDEAVDNGDEGREDEGGAGPGAESEGEDDAGNESDSQDISDAGAEAGQGRMAEYKDVLKALNGSSSILDAFVGPGLNGFVEHALGFGVPLDAAAKGCGKRRYSAEELLFYARLQFDLDPTSRAYKTFVRCILKEEEETKEELVFDEKEDQFVSVLDRRKSGPDIVVGAVVGGNGGGPPDARAGPENGNGLPPAVVNGNGGLGPSVEGETSRKPKSRYVTDVANDLVSSVDILLAGLFPSAEDDELREHLYAFCSKSGNSVLGLFGYVGKNRVKCKDARAFKCKLTYKGRKELLRYLAQLRKEEKLPEPRLVSKRVTDGIFSDFEKSQENAKGLFRRGGPSGGSEGGGDAEEGGDDDLGQSDVASLGGFGYSNDAEDDAVLARAPNGHSFSGPPLQSVTGVDRYFDPRLRAFDELGLRTKEREGWKTLPPDTFAEVGMVSQKDFVEMLSSGDCFVDVLCGVTSLEDGGRPSTHGPGYSCEAFSKVMEHKLSESGKFLVSVIPNCFSPHFHKRAVENVNMAPTLLGVGGRLHSFIRCASATSKKDPVPSNFRGGKSIIYQGDHANDLEFDYLKCAKFFMFYCQTVGLLEASGDEYWFVPYDCKDLHILAALIARSCYAKHSDFSATLVRMINDKGGIAGLREALDEQKRSHGGELEDTDEEGTEASDAGGGSKDAGVSFLCTVVFWPVRALVRVCPSLAVAKIDKVEFLGSVFFLYFVVVWLLVCVFVLFAHCPHIHFLCRVHGSLSGSPGSRARWN